MSDSGRAGGKARGNNADEPGTSREQEAYSGPSPEILACHELGHLLSSELAEVGEEIGRVTDIIAAAVAELSTSFDQLHRFARQREIEAESRTAEQLEESVSAAVRALQFEDIATQALAEALRSVSYLRRVADEVQTVHDTGEFAQRISEQHRRWEKMRRKAVLQKNLDTGAVDLF